MGGQGRVMRIAEIDVESYSVRDLTDEWVRRLTEVYETGERFRDIPEVTEVNGRFLLIKGHHRVEAARRALGNQGVIRVVVVEYENDAARWEAAASDNVTNGRPYTDAERERLYYQLTKASGFTRQRAMKTLGIPERRLVKWEQERVITKRAVEEETPSRLERARQKETPTATERASGSETTDQSERVAATETPSASERAIDAETTIPEERADPEETTSIPERTAADRQILFHVGRLADLLRAPRLIDPETIAALNDLSLQIRSITEVKP